MNEKQAIDLLIKIAERQQKIITKLSQVAPPDQHRDANIDYITHNLVAIVAANLRIPNVTATVTILPATPSGGSSGGYVAEQPAKYATDINGVPKAREQQFGNALIKQIQTQRPELAKVFSYNFV
jgi:hypothetical protein